MPKQAFALIELLIVVAIVSILAAIAVPNYLEAQVRAKVSRVKVELRLADLAVNLYIDDNDEVPLLSPGTRNRGPIYTLTAITTPVAYVTSTYFEDPFVPPQETDGAGGTPLNSNTIVYLNVQHHRVQQAFPEIGTMFGLLSFGPDTIRGPNGPWYASGHGGIGFYAGYDGLHPANTNGWAQFSYDPTNGTISGGDIMRWQVQ